MVARLDAEAARELAILTSVEYLEVVENGITSNARSQQRRIGPSEIGTPCTRALLHKLNEDPEPPRAAAWKPAVGTALHTQMDAWFSQASGHEGRWLTEQQVTVGQIGGVDITGHTDLWDEVSHAVIDHKFVSQKRLLDYKANGPGQQYRAQAHLYGRGWALAGKTVDLVMIAFLVRDGDLRDHYFWHEPYDEQVALDALARANSLLGQIRLLGIDEALSRYEPCNSPWCPWCSPIVPGQNRGLRRFHPGTGT